MRLSRGQLTKRKSSVADRYLKAIDDADNSPSNMNPSFPDSPWHKEAHVSLSGTASLSGSSRTPTPVRAQSRGALHSRAMATSPSSPKDPAQSNPSRIRLFPATMPVIGNEEDTTDGSSLMTPRTTETRSSGTQHNSPDPGFHPVAMHESSESSRGWRKRLEGTSRGTKTPPARHTNDSNWIKKKGSPRRLGASPRRLPPQLAPNSLKESTLWAQETKSDPSSAPTEIMMNLSSYKQSDQKSDFGGAATEVATNRATDRLRTRQVGIPKQSTGESAVGLNARLSTSDAVDESIEYALHQHMTERRRQDDTAQQMKSSPLPNQSDTEHYNQTPVEFNSGRLRRHVHNFAYNVFEASDSSFQSKSLTSSVGVETGGRSVDRTPVALRRVLELSPKGNGAFTESSWRNHNKEQVTDGVRIMDLPMPRMAPNRNSVMDQCDLGPSPVESKRGHTANRQESGIDNLSLQSNEECTGRSLAGSASIEHVKFDQALFVRNAGDFQSNGQEQPIVPDSPGSSGWTPVVLSLTGIDKEDFHATTVPPGERALQPLFSPDRVNQQVADMVEFGPPKINRTTTIDDVMTHSKFSNPTKGVNGVANDVTTLNRSAEFPIGISQTSHFATNESVAKGNPRSSTMTPIHNLSHDVVSGSRNRNHVDAEGESRPRNVSSLVQNRIKAFDKVDRLPKSVRKIAADDGASDEAYDQRDGNASSTDFVAEGARTTEAHREANIPSSDKYSMNGPDWGARGSLGKGNAPSTDFVASCTLSGDTNREPTNSSSDKRRVMGPKSVDSSGLNGRQMTSAAMTNLRKNVVGDVAPLSASRGNSNNPILQGSDLIPVEDIASGESSKVNARGVVVSKIGRKSVPNGIVGSGMGESAVARQIATERTSTPSATMSYSAIVTPSPNTQRSKDQKPLDRQKVNGFTVASMPTHLQENGSTSRKVAHSSASQVPRNQNEHSQHAVGSVSMIRSMFESQFDTTAGPDDDETTTESLDVKSIRSLFEEAQAKPLQQDEEGTVTKIRSIFERSPPQPLNGRTQMAVRNLETNSQKQNNTVRKFGNEAAGTLTHRRSPGSNARDRAISVSRGVVASEEAEISNYKSVSNPPQAATQPSIAERIQAMKLERNQPRGSSAKSQAEGPKLPLSTDRSRGSASDGYKSSSRNAADSMASSRRAQQKQLSKGVSPSRLDSVEDVAVAIQKDHSTPQNTHMQQAESPLKSQEAKIDTNHESNPPIHSIAPSVGERRLTGKKKLSSGPANRDAAGRDSQGYSSTLQGVVVRKPIKSEAKSLVYENRTDSEGYDDGVTLDLSIADVSCLTNPTCLRSKEDASLDGGSSRLSKDREVADGRGPSEASSSQTSEAAAPLLALTMRAKFTNSSDDFGHFSQRSFADRLSSSPQSKWIPLTSPIEENLVEAVEHTGDSSDPAWDLRNIKARFAERQAKKANKTRVEEAGGADLWEPFEPFHFPETPVAFDSRQDKIGLREDYGQGGAITADELNLGKDNVVAGTPDLDIGAFQRPRSQQNQATNVHRGPVDPPPMGSSTPKRSIQFTKQPQAAIPTTQVTLNPQPFHLEPYSQHNALMSKLLSLREARIRRNTAFGRKESNFGTSPPTQRKTAASIALQKQNVVTPQYLTVRSGTRPDEEEQSASTISSTRFGGRKFVDCLDVD
ncbi:hypothetical protein MHU86_13417 [Fragilaria crotonensis]|nr:hypothetical protein MHU86_13417 [Fragilaria crotonensis]